MHDSFSHQQHAVPKAVFMTTTGMSASSQSLSAQAEVSVFGITRWYSRYALPNAKPSPVVTHQQREAELSDIADGGVIATDPVSQPQAVAANNDSPTAPVQALSSGTETAQQVAPHAKRVAPSVGTDTVIADSAKDTVAVDTQETTPSESFKPCEPFTLWVIQAGTVVLIDSVGSNIDSLTQNMMVGLAQGILSECLQKPVETAIKQFQWPLFDHQYAPRDEASAKRMFNEFLEEHVDSTGVNTLLLCGDTAVKYTALQADGSWQQSSAAALTPIVVPRLSSLLYSASDKRALWSAIRATQ